MSVSAEDRKEFIEWFLKKFKLKRRESVWILNYIKEDESLIKNICFVDEAHFCNRAIIMSTTETNSVPFRYYRGNTMTGDAEKAFHSIREDKDERIYIQVIFPDNNTSPNYVGVLEENPFLPDYLKSKEEDRKLADAFVEHLERKMKLDHLNSQIDIAIDSGDRDGFNKISEEIVKISKKKDFEKRESG